MADVSDGRKIPKETREAFAQAVVDFMDWTFGGPEPLVTLDRTAYTVGGIFHVVEGYSDRVPDELYIRVCELALWFRTSNHGHHHECNNPEDHTYKGVAQCMLGLHRARTHHYQRKDLDRRPRDGV